MSGCAFAVTHHAFSSGAGRTSDGNGSHASTLKSPSYTKSVSWQHYLVPLIILFFFVVSLAYGIATRTIRHQADLPHLMIEPMKEMAGFIVMVFPLAQFVAMFNWSNMGKFIAVGLTDILESSGLSGIPAFVGLALLSSFLCMFIASGSAIWSILAPFSYQCLCYLAFTRHLRKSSFVLPTHPYCL